MTRPGPVPIHAPWKFGDIVAHPIIRNLHVMILKVGEVEQTAMVISTDDSMWSPGVIQAEMTWWTDDPSACGIKLDVS